METLLFVLGCLLLFVGGAVVALSMVLRAIDHEVNVYPGILTGSLLVTLGALGVALS